MQFNTVRLSIDHSGIGSTFYTADGTKIPLRGVTEAMNLCRPNNPIATIKVIHALTGCGLKEAKDCVDAVRALRAVKELG